MIYSFNNLIINFDKVTCINREGKSIIASFDNKNSVVTNFSSEEQAKKEFMRLTMWFVEYVNKGKWNGYEPYE